MGLNFQLRGKPCFYSIGSVSHLFSDADLENFLFLACVRIYSRLECGSVSQARETTAHRPWASVIPHPICPSQLPP